MTISILVDTIAEALKQGLSDIRLRDKTGALRAPSVFTGFLPTKRSGQFDDFPYILVRPIDGKDSDFEGTMRLRIILGVYDDGDDGQGFRDVANLIQRAKGHLEKNQDFGSAIQLNYPLEWTIYEEQVFPQFIGEIVTSWTLPMINMGNFSSDVEAYGDSN